jgi:hypothetical protein
MTQLEHDHRIWRDGTFALWERLTKSAERLKVQSTLHEVQSKDTPSDQAADVVHTA